MLFSDIFMVSYLFCGSPFFSFWPEDINNDFVHFLLFSQWSLTLLSDFLVFLMWSISVIFESFFNELVIFICPSFTIKNEALKANDWSDFRGSFLISFFGGSRVKIKMKILFPRMCCILKTDISYFYTVPLLNYFLVY